MKKIIDNHINKIFFILLILFVIGLIKFHVWDFDRHNNTELIEHNRLIEIQNLYMNKFCNYCDIVCIRNNIKCNDSVEIDNKYYCKLCSIIYLQNNKK